MNLSAWVGPNLVAVIKGFSELLGKAVQHMLIETDAPFGRGVRVAEQVLFAGERRLIGQQFPHGLEGAEHVVVSQIGRLGLHVCTCLEDVALFVFQRVDGEQIQVILRFLYEVV